VCILKTSLSVPEGIRTQGSGKHAGRRIPRIPNGPGEDVGRPPGATRSAKGVLRQVNVEWARRKERCGGAGGVPDHIPGPSAAGVPLKKRAKGGGTRGGEPILAKNGPRHRLQPLPGSPAPITMNPSRPIEKTTRGKEAGFEIPVAPQRSAGERWVNPTMNWGTAKGWKNRVASKGSGW